MKSSRLVSESFTFWNAIDARLIVTADSVPIDPWAVGRAEVEVRLFQSKALDQLVTTAPKTPAPETKGEFWSSESYLKIKDLVAVISDPWSPINESLHSESTEPLIAPWNDDAISIPNFDRALRETLWDSTNLNRGRLVDTDTRIRWIMALVGPLAKHRSKRLKFILGDLLASADESQPLFRRLCSLALEIDEPEDFSNTLSFKHWWLEHSEYWVSRNRAAGSFYYSQSGNNAMSWPMCLRIAQKTKTLCWELLPIDDWLEAWKQCRNVYQSGWDFAQWIHDKVVIFENFDYADLSERQTADDLIVMSTNQIFTGCQRFGSNIGPGSISNGKWKSEELRSRYLVWLEKQDKMNAKKSGF